jgi:hypothetical protein
MCITSNAYSFRGTLLTSCHCEIPYSLQHISIIDTNSPISIKLYDLHVVGGVLLTQCQHSCLTSSQGQSCITVNVAGAAAYAW